MNWFADVIESIPGKPAMLLMVTVCWCVGIAFAQPHAASAKTADIYIGALSLAAKGNDEAAIHRLQKAADQLPKADPWRTRINVAVAILEMRQQKTRFPKLKEAGIHQVLIDDYLKHSPAPSTINTWVTGLMATIIPGAGHAWLDRWHDAGVAALMVWPMLFLTLWAARRRMGPVTVFFSLITIWLWSGTIFSAVSLAERENSEMYMAWWQNLWLASGLQGRPW